MRRDVTPLLRSAVPNADDGAAALIPVSPRVAEMLAPTRTVPKYGDHGYEGVSEIWEMPDVTSADLPDLKRQLCLVESAMKPVDPPRLLARVLALLAQYRDSGLPAAVEQAIAEDFLEDLGEFPAWAIDEGCRQWRRHPTKYRFKPLPGDLRLLCSEIVGRLPIMATRIRKLLAAGPANVALESTGSRSDDIRSRVVALANARRMP